MSLRSAASMSAMACTTFASDVAAAFLAIADCFDLALDGFSTGSFGVESAFTAGDFRGLRTGPLGVKGSVVAISPPDVLEDRRLGFTTGAGFGVEVGGSALLLERMLEKDIGYARIGLISSGASEAGAVEADFVSDAPAVAEDPFTI